MKCQIPQISWHSRDPVLSIDFQPVSGDFFRLASGGTDSHVLIWYVVYDEHKTVKIECASDLYRHNKSVNVVRFSPSGEFLASGDDEGAMFVWQMKDRDSTEVPKEDDGVNKEDWYPVKLLRGHLEDIYDISWSKDGNSMVSASMDNSAIVWDMQKFVKLHIFSDFKGYVQGVSWDPLNKFIASLGSDRTMRIHNIATKRCVCRVSKAPWSNSTEKGSVKPRLFYDDTLKSYCRRLSYTPDGELIIAPSGIVEKGEKLTNACFVFSRHAPSKPILTLPTGDWYTVAVRCNPFLYKLRRKEAVEETGSEKEAIKTMIDLPYRMIFAVAAYDSVLMYDTEQLLPFSCISNIHYTHLTDLAWSPDGLTLIASSTDGYCSFIIFTPEELGEVYESDLKDMETDNVVDNASPQETPPKSILSLSSEISKGEPLVTEDLDKLKTPAVPEKKSPKLPSIKKFLVTQKTVTESPNSTNSGFAPGDVSNKDMGKTEPEVITLLDTPEKKVEPMMIDQVASEIPAKCKLRLDFSKDSAMEMDKESIPPKKSPKMSIKRFFITANSKKPDCSKSEKSEPISIKSQVTDVVSVEAPFSEQTSEKTIVGFDSNAVKTESCQKKFIPIKMDESAACKSAEAQSIMSEKTVSLETVHDQGKPVFKESIDKSTIDVANNVEKQSNLILQKEQVQMEDTLKQDALDECCMEVDNISEKEPIDKDPSKTKADASAVSSNEPVPVEIRNLDENASDGCVSVFEVSETCSSKEIENDWKLELSQDDDAMEVCPASSEKKPPETKTTTKRRIPLITLSTSISPGK